MNHHYHHRHTLPLITAFACARSGGLQTAGRGATRLAIEDHLDAQNHKRRDCVASGGLETAPPSYRTRSFFRLITAALTAAFACVCAFAATASAAPASASAPAPAPFRGESRLVVPFSQGWLFGGKASASPDALKPEFNDSAFERVTLPHCVVKLSWQKWDYNTWQHVWLYRKHFTVPAAFKGQRVFVRFEAAMTSITPTINGHALPTHKGGYLPARYELTDFLAPDGADNVLAVEVDSRWQNVPPQGKPDKKTEAVDYYEPGGITRQAWLEAVPAAYISDVFAKPVSVLDAANRRVDVICALDAAASAAAAGKRGTLMAELRDGANVVARAEREVAIEKQGVSEAALALTNLAAIKLWSPESPKLYTIVTTLTLDGQPAHEYTTRIGFREARFAVDGFYLNGKRYRIFGLDRHELFPYVGGAMPPRVQRRDAEILKNDLNCNFVRCSHYPQSDAFLDACDELGLLVWEEVPGWGYIGDEAWKKLSLQNTRDMIMRDRNRPSVVIWGTRPNETRNDEDLHARARAIAKSLDDTRPTSGSMTGGTRKSWKENWHEDVFAFDDYGTKKPGEVGILNPVGGVPYMLAEVVGQFNYDAAKDFTNRYRRAGDTGILNRQALFHAQAHDRAAAKPGIAGAVAWCAFDYGSPVKGFDGVKCPGVVDTFRIPKPGAAFYQTQRDIGGGANGNPLILPSFFWDFGPATPRGPGKHAAIFSNCDQLIVYINNQKIATLAPDAKNYPNLKHPPFFVDLDLDAAATAAKPELKIEGYAAGKLALTRQFSSDATQDQFVLAADDAELTGDGSDATRVEFKVVDKYGAERAFAKGAVRFELAGPGALVGDNPFDLDPAGGVGAVWVRAAPGGSGVITLTARHPQFAPRQVTVAVTQKKD